VRQLLDAHVREPRAHLAAVAIRARLNVRPGCKGGRKAPAFRIRQAAFSADKMKPSMQVHA
jgi:hypothetical protein